MLGDDDDDAEESDSNVDLSRSLSLARNAAENEPDDELPPRYDENGDPVNVASEKGTEEAKRSQPQLHYLQPDDTLLGLSMRYGVDVSEQIRTNPSALR